MNLNHAEKVKVAATACLIHINHIEIMIITISILIIAAFICAVILQRRKHAAYLARRDKFLARLNAENNAFAQALQSLEKK